MHIVKSSILAGFAALSITALSVPSIYAEPPKVEAISGRSAANVVNAQQKSSSITTPEIAKSAIEEIGEQKKSIENFLLQKCKEEGSNVTRNGDIIIVSKALFFERDMKEKECLTLLKRLEYQNAPPVKDEAGNVTGINRKCYSVLLPDTKINISNSTGSINFINLTEFIIQKFGQRPIHETALVNIRYDNTALSRNSISLSTYTVPFLGNRATIYDSVISKDYNGIKFNDIEMDNSKLLPKAKEIKTTSEKIFRNGINNLTPKEKYELKNKLADFFKPLH